MRPGARQLRLVQRTEVNGMARTNALGRTTWSYLLALSTLSGLSQGCSRSSAATEASPAVVASAAAGQAELEWPPLKVLRYQLELKSASATTLAGVPFKLGLAAVVELVALERAGEKSALLMRLREPKLTVEGAEPNDDGALAKELGQPYWLALERGKIVETRISEGLSGQAVSILRTISSGLQLSTPSGGATQTKPWTAKEFDATGEYEARYEALPDGSIRRQKQRFVETLITGKVTAVQRAAVLPQVLQANATLLAKGRLLEKVTSREQLKSQLLGSESVTVTTELSLVRDGEPPAPPTPEMLKLTGDLLPLSPSRAYGVSDARAAFDALRAENANIDGVLAALEKVATKPDKRALVGAVNDQDVNASGQEPAKQQLSERTNELSKLTGLLRVKPETITVVEAAIVKGSPAASMLLDGLSAAGTDAAQQALGRLVATEKLSAELRAAAATSMIRVAHASPATIELLRGLIHDPVLQEHAIFGLGTAARRLAENEQAARSDAIVDVLISGLAQAKTTQDRVRWLRGIANSGAAKALPPVLPLVDDKDRQLRSAALEAMRLMKSPRVDEVVTQRLKDEPLALVRETALQVVVFRGPNRAAEQALLQLAQNDSDRAIKSAARRALVLWAKANPGLQASLDALPVDKP